MYRITKLRGWTHMDMQEASTEPNEAELDEALARAVRQLIADAVEADAEYGSAGQDTATAA